MEIGSETSGVTCLIGKQNILILRLFFMTTSISYIRIVNRLKRVLCNIFGQKCIARTIDATILFSDIASIADIY